MKLHVLAVVAVTVLGHAFAAGALESNHGGKVDSEGISVHVEVITPGIDTPVDLSGNTSTNAVDFEVVSEGPARPGDLSALCNAGTNDDGLPIFGYRHHVIGTERATGKIVYDHVSCIPILPDGERPPAPPTPQLPTIEEAWRAAQLPDPAINLDPATRGITGLDTRIWTSGPTTITIAASVRGYTITGTASVTGYTIKIDDEPAIRTMSAGDAAHPIAHHTFETKGTHTVRVGVIWHGMATFTGPDLRSPITTDIGEATVTAIRNYPVHEVRSVLQP